MIITRSPLRITLGGGGTDLPSYYKRSGGFLISAAINKYIYTSILEPYADGIYLKYSNGIFLGCFLRIVLLHYPVG